MPKWGPDQVSSPSDDSTREGAPPEQSCSSSVTVGPDAPQPESSSVVGNTTDLVRARFTELDPSTTAETDELTFVTTLTLAESGVTGLPASTFSTEVDSKSLDSQPPASTSASPACTATEPGKDQAFGTALNWIQDLETASTAASKQHKLLFVLQVSGNFAIEEFT